jgi:hypothetical protein
MVFRFMHPDHPELTIQPPPGLDYEDALREAQAMFYEHLAQGWIMHCPAQEIPMPLGRYEVSHVGRH